MLIFWTFAFPIILGTFFYMAFSNIENSEKLDIINIAIVENNAFNTNKAFKETFKNLSDEKEENQLFNTKYVSEEEARELLEEEKIEGYLIFSDTPKIVVKKSGINETILKQVTEEILENEEIIKNIISKEKQNTNVAEIGDINTFYTRIYQEVENLLENSKANIEDISSHNLSYTMIEYYTLIAMTCLYGGILGMTAINGNLPNMSNNGKRVAISPIPKRRLIISSVLASFLTQIIGLALLFIYTIFVLKVDYGTNLPLIILLALVGSLAGLSLGIALSSLLKTSENTKMGIMISITMLGCFLSGMMGITMKYVIDKNAPIINILNPANMITDGFYSLYYYPNHSRFYFNIISLLVFALLLISLSVMSLRRQKYDSI